MALARLTSPPCPGPDRLLDLLADHLPADESARLSSHLETCENCQHTLDELTTVRQLWPGPADEVEPPVEPALRRLMDDLRTQSGIDAEDSEPAGPGSEDVTDQLGRLDHYDVLELIGRGGMGVVLKAFDQKLKRVVAIKLLAARLARNGAARRRFVREAQLAAAVHHENVVAIYSVEDEKSPPYLVMEHVQGMSLQDRLDSGALDVADIVRIGREVAAGLAAAHARGLIHRDVKPGNILLEQLSGRVKLTDFGLARTADDAGWSQTGVVAGTPQYMSPEQARGETVDHRSDLFSLGGVLYALCTGRPPFQSDGALATLKKVCDAEPEPLVAARPTIPAGFASVIERLLEKDPARRFQSAGEVIEALNRLDASATSQTLVTTAPGSRRRRRWSRRQTMVAAGFLAASLVFCTQIIVRIKDKDGKTTEIPVPQGGSVSVSKDGQLVANVSSGEDQVGEVWRGKHNGRVWHVAFTPSGRHVLSASEDKSVRVSETASGKEVQHFEGHQGFVYALAVDPKGVWALSVESNANHNVDGNWRVCQWEIDTAKLLHSFSGTGKAMTSLAVSPDGRKAIFGNYGGTVVVFDVENWKELRRFQTDLGLWSVRFSPDERGVLTAGGHQHRGHLCTWNLETGKEDRRYEGPFQGGWEGIYSRDGKQIFFADNDGHVLRVLDAATAMEIGRMRHESNVTSVALTPDGKRAVSGGYDKCVRVWDIEKRAQTFCFEGHSLGVQSVAVSPDGKLVASGSHDRTVRLWRLPP
jgi:serine/threonine protein kinase